MKTRIILIALIGYILAACSGAPTPAPTTAPVPTAAPTQAPTPAPTEAPTIAPAPTEAATAQPEADAFPRTITDGAGNKITLETPPERVICLYHSCLEYLASLGIEPIAAPEWSHVWQFAENPLYFSQPTTITKLKMTDNGPDLEHLAQLKPDLVFGWAELKESLEGIAPLHDVGALAGSYKGSLEELRSFSTIFGKEQEAVAIIKAFEDRVAAYKKLSPRTLTILNTGGDGKDFWITTFDSVPCSLFNEVSICEWPNPNPVPGVWGYASSIETVLQLDPDVVIFESWTDKTSAEISAELEKTNPLWGELSAVKNKRVFEDQGRASYGIGTVGGTRLLDTYMPLLYPEVFPEPLTDEQVEQILAQ